MLALLWQRASYHYLGSRYVNATLGRRPNFLWQSFHRSDVNNEKLVYMAIDIAIDIRTLAMINVVVQLVLIVLVFGAVYLARRGRVARHCAIQRGTVTIQIIAILSIMLPSLLGFIQSVPSIPLFYPELLVHHSLGLILVGMWIYINLEVKRIIRPFIKRKTAMRLALGVWLIAIALGLNIYYTLYAA